MVEEFVEDANKEGAADSAQSAKHSN